MAKFTMTLRMLTQSYDIGLQDYPLFSEAYRERLNRVIVNHFMFREISADTPAKFVFWLNARMDEIMPYYNTLYKAIQKADGTLLTTEIEHTIETDNEQSKKSRTQAESNSTGSTESDDSVHATNSASSSSNSSTTDSNRFSDTPQGMISQGAFAENTYLTNASENLSTTTSTDTTGSNNVSDSTSSSSSESSSASNEEKDIYTYGTGSTRDIKRGFDKKSLATLFGEYREHLVNIDMLIIRDLEPLFIQVL